MAAFDATKPCVSMYPGDIEILNSSTSLTGANLSRAVAPCNSLGGNPATFTIINKSSVALNVKFARDYVAADFETSGYSVGSQSTLTLSTTAPFVAVLPTGDPGSGEISICR